MSFVLRLDPNDRTPNPERLLRQELGGVYTDEADSIYPFTVPIFTPRRL